MTELTDFDEEFIQRLRETTATFIEAIEADYDGELPVKTIYVVENGQIIEKEIDYPRAVIDAYYGNSSSILRETAEWLEEHPDKSYRWEGEIVDPSLDSKTIYAEDIISDPNQEQLIRTFENDLISLSSAIVSYTGELTWNEKEFEIATKEWLIDHSFLTSTDYISKEFKSVSPLINLSSVDRKIELEPDLPIVNRYDKEWVSHIEISELTPTEIASIYTFENARKIGEAGAHDEASYAIKIKMNGSPSATNDNQVRAAVVTALRLLKPQEPAVHGDKLYRLLPGSLNYREGIIDVQSASPAMSTPLPPHSKNTYELDSHDKKDLENFWSTYNNILNIESGRNIAKSLRRYNEMHQKPNLEDQVVDCAIALEGTLLQDINPGSSLTFRLMLRSGLLLDKIVVDRKRTMDFFRALYRARGDIVHSNKQLEEIIDDGQFDFLGENGSTPREIVKTSQYLLAYILRLYMKKEVEDGKSIAEVNQEMDTAALNANYWQN